MASSQQPLVIEGKDDEHTILQLLKLGGVLSKDMSESNSPIAFTQAKSKEALITEIPVRLKSAGISVIGYVVDADDDASTIKGLKPTWDAIRARLAKLGVSAEPTIPPEGFIAAIEKTNQRIGVWVMPNNSSDGALEDFLISQINEDNQLFQFAAESTKKVALQDLPDRFRNQDESKATLRCWLAWLEDPGQPYGIAMRAKRFDISCETATRFLSWVRQLYDI